MSSEFEQNPYLLRVTIWKRLQGFREAKEVDLMGRRRTEINDDRIMQNPVEGNESCDLDTNLLEHCSEDEAELIRELNG